MKKKSLKEIPSIWACDSETSFLSMKDQDLAKNGNPSEARVRATLSGALKIDYKLETYSPKFSTFKELIDWQAENIETKKSAAKIFNRTIINYFHNLAYDGSFLLNEFKFLNDKFERKVDELINKYERNVMKIKSSEKYNRPDIKAKVDAWCHSTLKQKEEVITKLIYDNERLKEWRSKIDIIKAGSRLISIKFEYRGKIFDIRDSLALYSSPIASIGKSLSANPNNGNLVKLTGDLDYMLIKHNCNDYTEKELGYFWRDIEILAYLMASHFGRKPVSKYVKNGKNWITLEESLKSKLALPIDDKTYRKIANRIINRQLKQFEKEFTSIMQNLTSTNITLTASALAISELKETIKVKYTKNSIPWVPRNWKVVNGKIRVNPSNFDYMKPRKKDYKFYSQGEVIYQGLLDNYNKVVADEEKLIKKFIDSLEVRSEDEYNRLKASLFGKGLFPNIESYNYFKNAYYGGFTYVDYEHVGEDFGYGFVLDRNSMYPSAMSMPLFPDVMTALPIEVSQDELMTRFKKFKSEIAAGTPESERFINQEFRVYTIQTTDFRLNITNKLGFKSTPILPKILNSFSGEPLQSSDGLREPFYKTEITDNDAIFSNVMYLTEYDLMHFMLNYDFKDLEVLKCIKMDALPENPFNFFVSYFGRLKVDSKRSGDGVMTMYAKLCLNSSYGKFGQRWDLPQSNFSIVDNLEYRSFKPDESEFFNSKGESDVNNVVIAMMVTARARDNLFKTIYAVHQSDDFNFVYSDTDSVHIVFKDQEKGQEILNNPNRQDLYQDLFSELGVFYDDAELGAWKVEDEFVKSKYLRAKVYIEVHPESKNNLPVSALKVAGVGAEGKQEIKRRIGLDKKNSSRGDWDLSQFELGEKLSHLPVKINTQGKGGMVLADGFKDISPKDFATTPYFERGTVKEYVKE